MDKATFDKYKEDRYLDQMKYYNMKAGMNQKKYKQYQWILIILSALTPVIAALNGIKGATTDPIFSNSMNILVVTISSIVAILTTGMKTFNYQELWLTYRATYEKLIPEVYYYEFNIGEFGKPGIDKESLFVSRVEAILDTEHNQWPPAKKLSENQNAPPSVEPVPFPVANAPANSVVKTSADNSVTTVMAGSNGAPKAVADNEPVADHEEEAVADVDSETIAAGESEPREEK